MSIEKVYSIDKGPFGPRVGIQLTGNAADRVQSHTGPVAFLIVDVEVRGPIVRRKLLKIRLQKFWVESKRQFAITDHSLCSHGPVA